MLGQAAGEGQRRGDPPQSLGTYISVATDAVLMIELNGMCVLSRTISVVRRASRRCTLECVCGGGERIESTILINEEERQKHGWAKAWRQEDVRDIQVTRSKPA